METRVDGRLVRGDQTRRLVLRKAVDIASVDGLEGLSIGRLAKELDASKSGVFAHFGSKEELQLATIRAARRIYADAVVEPALTVEPGLARVWTLSESWLEYSRPARLPGRLLLREGLPRVRRSPRPGARLPCRGEPGVDAADRADHRGGHRSR